MEINQEVLSHITNCSVSYQVTFIAAEEIKYGSGVFVGPDRVLTVGHTLPDDDSTTIAVRNNDEFVFVKSFVVDRDLDLALLTLPEELTSSFATCAQDTMQDLDPVIVNSFLKLNPKSRKFQPGSGKGTLKGSFCTCVEGFEAEAIGLFKDIDQKPRLVTRFIPFNLPVRPSDSGSGIFNKHGKLVSIAIGVTNLHGTDLMGATDEQLTQDEAYTSWGIPLDIVKPFLQNPSRA